MPVTKAEDALNRFNNSVNNSINNNEVDVDNSCAACGPMEVAKITPREVRQMIACANQLAKNLSPSEKTAFYAAACTTLRGYVDKCANAQDAERLRTVEKSLDIWGGRRVLGCFGNVDKAREIIQMCLKDLATQPADANAAVTLACVVTRLQEELGYERFAKPVLEKGAWVPATKLTGILQEEAKKYSDTPLKDIFPQAYRIISMVYFAASGGDHPDLSAVTDEASAWNAFSILAEYALLNGESASDSQSKLSDADLTRLKNLVGWMYDQVSVADRKMLQSSRVYYWPGCDEIEASQINETLRDTPPKRAYQLQTPPTSAGVSLGGKK